MKPKDPAYLRHILDAITSIEEFSEGISSVEDLRGRRDRAHADHHRRGGKDDLAGARAGAPGDPLEGSGRNARIIHHYFGVDYEAIFLTVHDDLPVLKQGIQSILNEANRRNTPGGK
ncbi:MAG: hypothetical protein XE10_2031 [Methanoculleus marisnigri]|jgi:uncharacterized protein with HEPN domain|uniref:DUF86 domain-containing protein n=1 Tax=Methanoculleus marisnigri TaxID=2198 RepID=A0A101INM1_9EURY|nr:HepT-like ribonuclease domain-containing protein [Methanoculleus marisnigri]KUK98522.1 MAG: hypothetical protein XE10_2031 [Methanoculleus marisnigri]